MMDKNYRKVISIMLCAIMIFIMTPQVFADDLNEISTTADESGSTIIAEDVLNNGVKWTIYEDGLLEISGAGDVPDYYSNNMCSAPWYTYAELINKIIVTNDVKSIGYGAFYGCENVTDITLPFVGQSRDATGYRAMFGYVFGATTYRSSNLWKYERSADVFINRHARDSYNEVNSWYSSYGYQGFCEELYLRGYPMSACTVYYLLTWSFFVPEKLKSVTITDATKIEDAAFNNCKNITDIRINEGVTSIGNYAFQGCTSLENEPIPVTGISLDKTTASMATGETLALTPVFAPETATNKTVIWSSSDNTVATVEDGVVTAVKKGSATITVKTEDGGFTASCVVTVNCAHANKTEHPAEASTCTKHGHADYTTCDDCGEVIEGSANELPLADHTDGTATCTKKAVCEVCHKEYGGLAAHSYTEAATAEHIKTAATCTKKAVYYKSCGDCGTNGTEIFEYGELDHENHTGEEVWDQTETKHTKKWNCCGKVTVAEADHDFEDGVCTVCAYPCTHKDENTDHLCDICGETVSEHTDVNTDHKCDICGETISTHTGGSATCKDKAICELCGEKYGELDHENHTGKEVWEQTETNHTKKWNCCGAVTVPESDHEFEDGVCTVCAYPCTHKDENTDHKCDVCGVTVSGHSDENHDHVCDLCGETISTHTGGTATCKDKAVCEICGEAYGELDANNHTGKEVWEQTESKHTKKWNCCGKVTVAEADHEFEDGVCTTCAYPCAHKDDNTDHLCDICGETVSTHTGGTATCKDKAICEICGEEYGELDANNHTGKEVWEQTETKHTKKWNCCGKVTVPEADHEFENGVCAVCAYPCTHKDDNTDHICDLCGMTVSDHTDSDNNHLCDICGETVSTHTGGTATCKDKAICEICGEAYGDLDPENHTGKEVWDQTETKHTKKWNCCGKVTVPEADHEFENGVCAVCAYPCAHKDENTDHKCDICGMTVSEHNDGNSDHKCDVCGETISTHSDENHDHICDICGETISTHTGGTATCKDKAVCEICGEAYGELNPENHTGGTHLEHEKPATCTEKGYTGDTYCNGCNEKIADGSEIPTKPHTPGEKWVIENGKKVKKCTECGAVVDTLKRLPGDVDDDGKITVIDCLYLKRYILGTFNGTINLENADVDGNGRIDAMDYLYLKRGYLGTFDLSKFA